MYLFKETFMSISPFFHKKKQCQIHDLEFERDLQNITCPSKTKDTVVCLERLNI